MKSWKKNYKGQHSSRIPTIKKARGTTHIYDKVVTQLRPSPNIFILFFFLLNWSLQSFRQVYNLPSPTMHVVRDNFIHDRRDLQFKIDSEGQIFEKFFLIILFTLRVFGRRLLRGSCHRNICSSYLSCGSNLWLATYLTTATLIPQRPAKWWKKTTCQNAMDPYGLMKFISNIQGERLPNIPMIYFGGST